MTVVEQFAADHFVVNGVTAHRQADVRMCLRRLEEFAGRPPEQCTDLDLRAFLADEVGRGLHINTVNFHLRCIKPFYNWCWRQRLIDAEQIMRIRDVRPPRGSTTKGQPRPYKRHELDRFYDQLDKRWPLSKPNMVKRFGEGKSKYNKVWRHGIHLQIEAIVSLALFAGMRNSEIHYADLDEIHPDNDYIVVRGKSAYGERRGYREVPYTEDGRELMGRWLEYRALCNPDHDRPWLKLSVFASPNNTFAPGHPFEPIGDDAWRRLLLGVGPWELHRFRHTCATEWLRAGMPLEKVQKLLGHARITDTLAYTKLLREDVRDSAHRHEREFGKAVGRMRRAA